MLVSWSEGCFMTTANYRKPTHTDRCYYILLKQSSFTCEEGWS